MQSLKKFVMLAMVTVFGAALAVGSAQAQRGLAVDVPFAFVVGKSTMPSGHYRIARSGDAFASFVGENGEARFAMLLPSGDISRNGSDAYLVFTRYSHETFLNKVVFSSGEVYELPTSGKEKELRAQLKSTDEMAVLVQPIR